MNGILLLPDLPVHFILVILHLIYLLDELHLDSLLLFNFLISLFKLPLKILYLLIQVKHLLFAVFQLLLSDGYPSVSLLDLVVPVVLGVIQVMLVLGNLFLNLFDIDLHLFICGLLGLNLPLEPLLKQMV